MFRNNRSVSRGLLTAITAVLTLPSVEAMAAYRQDVLVCDGGTAVVKVDIGERRSLQLTLKNRDIKHYFIKEITKSRNDGIGGMGYSGSIGGMLPEGKFELDIEINGWAQNGIFHSSEFSGFQAGENIHNSGVKDCAPHSGNGCPGSYGSNAPTFLVKRQGNGLKVEAWRPRNVGRYCTEQDGYSLQCISYTSPSGWEALELANWHFQSCEQREILP